MITWIKPLQFLTEETLNPPGFLYWREHSVLCVPTHSLEILPEQWGSNPEQPKTLNCLLPVIYIYLKSHKNF